MSIQHLKLSDIDEANIKALIDNGIRESKTLDYKLALPGDSRDDRKEFIYDVTSFANASGGDIIYGVSEHIVDGRNTGQPEAIMGITENVDQAILKLESIIRDGVEPRIVGHHFKPIPISDGGSVIVLRIPRSVISPHAATLYGGFRFYSRNSAGKYRLDVGELKSAFVNQYQTTEILYRFINERTAAIISGEAPHPIADQSKLLLFLLPFNRDHVIDLQEFQGNTALIKLPYFTYGDDAFNADGIIAWNNSEERLSYVQLYHNGTVEGVTVAPAMDSKLVAREVEKIVLEFYSHYLKVLADRMVSCPFLVDIQVHGVKGLKIPHGDEFYEFNPEKYRIDRDIVRLPETIIRDFSDDLPKTFKRAFDTLWQASGRARSFSYDEAGNYIPGK